MQIGRETDIIIIAVSESEKYRKGWSYKMMEIKEKSPLPERCLNCPDAKEGEAMGVGPDAYCYNCDYALDRFEIINPPSWDLLKTRLKGH